MFIVFDTNIWVSEFGLNSPKGAAVRFYLRQRDAIVAIPEVVQLEIERNLTRELSKLRETISSGHRQLLTIFGKLKEIVLPTDEQIREKVAEVVSRLDVQTRFIPFSPDAARSSYLKTIDKVPPSDKAQEFKDGVIWAHCVELLSESEVRLVTSDKAFYAGRNYENGLAKNLLAEIATCTHRFSIIPNISDLIEEIRRDVLVNERNLVAEFMKPRQTNIDDMLRRYGFRLEDPPSVNFKLYATEEASRLYIEFEIKYKCKDSTDQNRPDAMLQVRGDGSYDSISQQYLNLRSQGEKLEYVDVDGQQNEHTVINAYGSAIIGHRSVEHTVRFPLA